MNPFVFDLRVLGVVLVGLIQCFGVWAATDFAGRYESESGIVFSLEPAGEDRFEGEIDIGESVGKLRFDVSDDLLVGELDFEGEVSTVELYPTDGDGWILTDGSFSVDLVREAPARKSSPLAGFGRKNANEQPEEVAEEVGEAEPQLAIPDDWQRYEHSTGASFSVPGNWYVQEGANFLQIVPPDLRYGLEMMYVIGAPGQAGVSADDPQVAQQLDMVIQQSDPSARHVGEVERITTQSGKAGVYQYQGRNAFTGQVTRARVYVIVGDAITASFFLAGDEQALNQRGETLDRIVASYSDGATASQGVGQAQEEGAMAGNLDASLLGYWYGEAVSRPMEGMMVNSRFTYLFRRDGIVFLGAQGAVNAASQGSAGVYNGGGASGVSGDVDRGRWSAVNGVLQVQWDDGSQSNTRYQIRGKTLEIRDHQGKLLTFYER